ncbi:esterase/lipase family protein [Granulosicoccus antarcticus]|uniref:AB hydrolase-1 domain-containing protein n=1 Tax=Granulosicoccus antarcticus IMCC3135 TaxID=1192854 RepID=A0A2Z2NYR8_9GAMM|nr:alpha/beta hydrolase [Granulosicoccus antarcticus]ASJ75575.1 hypothetical protein IMCC3135_27610 [Granulosicoccus antarcticus IMCC3135]
MTSNSSEPLPGQITVLVHGIWMHGVVMRVMGRMLEARGFRTHSVSYNFLKRNPAENARKLHDEIGVLGAKSINLVGHSLGGIVILHLLHEYPELAVNKVVLIGSPVRGSYVASRVNNSPALRRLLGRSIEGGLLGGAPGFAAGRPLGIITGNGKLGITSLLYPVGTQSDGVVRESETLIDNASDRICLPLSHSTLIFSRQCTDYVARFLTLGRFRE